MLLKKSISSHGCSKSPSTAEPSLNAMAEITQQPGSKRCNCRIQRDTNNNGDGMCKKNQVCDDNTGVSSTWRTAKLAKIAPGRDTARWKNVVRFQGKGTDRMDVYQMCPGSVLVFARAVLICSVCSRNRASDISGNAPHGYLLLAYQVF